MKQYQDLMQRILDKGSVKNPARKNMPRTKELFAETMKFDLAEGFPLLTTKKMALKVITEELLWFLKGSTNTAELMNVGCNIWNQDTYKLYLRRIGKSVDDFNEEEFRRWVRNANDENSSITHEAGHIYGYLWRNWDNEVDQIQKLVNTILNNSDSRYQIVSAWNPSVIEENDIALPSCHILWQTNVTDNRINLVIYQRSADYFLGVPFNIASYAILIHILAELTGYEPGVLTWIGGSVHIYENHVDQCNIQLSRKPTNTPTLEVTMPTQLHEDIQVARNMKNFSSELLTKIFSTMIHGDHIKIKDGTYNPYAPIKAVLTTGLSEASYERKWN